MTLCLNPSPSIPIGLLSDPYFQREVFAGEAIAFYSEDASMGSMVKDIAGMLYGNLTGDELQAVLEEISKNLTGVVSYNYTFGDPTQMNIPGDALGLVPFAGYAKNSNSGCITRIKNSATGTVSTSSFGNTLRFDFSNIVGGFINFVINVGTVVWDFAKSVANIVCKAIAAVIATAAEFIQQLADALKNFGMAMLGAFKEAMEKVKDAVEKVVNVINAIVDWIVEQVGAIVQFVIDKITDLLSGLEEAYKNLLYTLISLSSESDKIGYQLTMSGPSDSYSELGIIADFFELVIAFAMDFVLISLTITAMILAITAATGGLAALADFVIEQGIGDMVVGLLFTAALAEVFGEIGEIIQNNDDNSGGGFTVLAGFLGLSGSIVEKLVNIGETTSVYTKGKIGILGYYIGLTLAFTGLLAPIVIPSMNLHGEALIKADAFSLFLAVAGFTYSRLLAKKDAQVNVNEAASPWFSKIELVTSIAGVASPAIKLGADLTGGN